MAFTEHGGAEKILYDDYRDPVAEAGEVVGSILELQAVLDHAAAGRLKPVIDRALPLGDARAAVQHVLDRKNRGKMLLVP